MLKKNNSHHYSLGIVLVLLAGVFWSTQGVAVRLMENADAWQILFYRSLGLTGFLFIVLVFSTSGRPVALVRSAGMSGVIGGLCLLFGYSGAMLAMQQTTIANAVLLFTTGPFIAAFLGWIFLRERVRTHTWVAMVVVLAGVITMVGFQPESGDLLGNAFALVSALGFAVFTVVLRWKRQGNMLPAVFISGILTTIVAGSICQSSGAGVLLSSHDMLLSIAMGVGQTGLGLMLYTAGSRWVPAAELALLPLIELILSPLWVWVFIGETVSRPTLMGGGVIVLALLANTLANLKAERQRKSLLQSC